MRRPGDGRHRRDHAAGRRRPPVPACGVRRARRPGAAERRPGPRRCRRCSARTSPRPTPTPIRSWPSAAIDDRAVAEYAATVSTIEGVDRVDAYTGRYAGGQLVQAPTPDLAALAGDDATWFNVIPVGRADLTRGRDDDRRGPLARHRLRRGARRRSVGGAGRLEGRDLRTRPDRSRADRASPPSCCCS